MENDGHMSMWVPQQVLIIELHHHSKKTLVKKMKITEYKNSPSQNLTINEESSYI